MSDPAIQDRAAGAIMGAFIGDALGLGPHWYYDLAVSAATMATGSLPIPIPSPAATIAISRRANSPRGASFSGLCCARSSSAEAMMKWISAGAWMRKSSRCSTACP